MNKTKKDFLENYSSCPELAKKVFRQMVPTWPEVIRYPDDYRDASAGVGGFIYYTETRPFAKRNIELIREALNIFENEIGEPLKKDNDNLLNWYAWFALEHVINEVICYKEN